MAKKEDLEERIRILEDCEAIKKLKSRYLYRVDERDWDGVLDCFAELSKADYGPFGKYESKEEIGQFFREAVDKGYLFMMHKVLNPLIEIRGEKAKGRWYLNASVTPTEKNKAVWVAGRYDDEFVKERGEWKIKLLMVTFYYVTPFDKGWVEERIMV